MGNGGCKGGWVLYSVSAMGQWCTMVVLMLFSGVIGTVSPCINDAQITVLLCISGAQITVLLCISGAQLSVLLCISGAQITVLLSTVRLWHVNYDHPLC